jgi:hypothetical protein
MPRKTWVDDFNLKNYFSFTQPLLLSTGINALIAYTPSHVLNQEVFGKYNFLIRLTNLMTEPVKILLNSNFYTSALSGNIADQNNIIEKLLRVFKYCCLILTFIGMWVPVVNSGYYWAVPMIVYFELEAFHYFNDRKIRGITRFNWLYNAIFLFCIYSFFVSLEQYWIIGIFFARFMALFAAKIVLDKFLK